ncbi:hypothetical protein ABIB25_002450 [Nakamurella sp. UYEF19]|uniref:hypothetical protein n=1 Tax=Nakamurella sp. UYEF19 TaxID=1756392 RepID=UPI003399AA8F
MPDKNGWRIHREDPSGDLVLAVDFPVGGRGEAGFNEFAPLLSGSFAVWETLPLCTSEGEVSGRAEIERWLPEVRGSGRTVVAILSFCAGAAFVEQLAAGIVQWQEHTPELILFDPEVPGPLTLQTQLVRGISRFAPLFSDEENAAHLQHAEQALALCNGNIEELLSMAIEDFHRVAEIGFPRAGIDLKYGREMMNAFDWFTRYLVGGAQLKQDWHWPTATAITSRTPTSGLNQVDAEFRGDVVARELHVDVDHVGMLAESSVAELVASLLVRTATV